MLSRVLRSGSACRHQRRIRNSEPKYAKKAIGSGEPSALAEISFRRKSCPGLPPSVDLVRQRDHEPRKQSVRGNSKHLSRRRASQTAAVQHRRIAFPERRNKHGPGAQRGRKRSQAYWLGCGISPRRIITTRPTTAQIMADRSIEPIIFVIRSRGRPDRIPAFGNASARLVGLSPADGGCEKAAAPVQIAAQRD